MLINLISRHLIAAFEELPINLHLQSHIFYSVCFTYAIGGIQIIKIIF